MLLAVEGGGFFSSSSSGYSKGLTLLLLGRKSEERQHMKVTPWNHYQLVDQESNPRLQLASGKSCLVPGCASFACLGNSAAGPEGPSPPNVEPARNTGSLECEDKNRSVDSVGEDGGNRQVGNSLKSTLKKSVSIDEKENDGACRMERKKVQWTDAVGGELFETREFEMSEDESDDEFDHANGRTCACSIM